MNKLILLTNELQNPKVQRQLNLPLEFITFGIADGKLYKHFNNQSNFVLPLTSSKRWGNNVVYGGLFLCNDFDFYVRILDAYHACSLNMLSRNHINDIHHRVEVEVTAIHFNTLEDLKHLKYRESEVVRAYTYYGNPNHPKIKQRFNKSTSYRIVSGIDAENFKQLFWEVTK